MPFKLGRTKTILEIIQSITICFIILENSILTLQGGIFPFFKGKLLRKLRGTFVIKVVASFQKRIKNTLSKTHCRYNLSFSITWNRTQKIDLNWKYSFLWNLFHICVPKMVVTLQSFKKFHWFSCWGNYLRNVLKHGKQHLALWFTKLVDRWGAAVWKVTVPEL